MLAPGTAAAQGFEQAGARARGMGAAFVAVADDASAAWWNPAGLPGTLIVDGVVDVSGLDTDLDAPIAGDAVSGRHRTALVAVAFPAGALSYARLHEWRAEPAPTGGGGGGRQEGGHIPAARSLLTHHFGVSFAHSLGDAVVVGMTTRMIRGAVSSAPGDAATAGASFDRASDASRVSATRGDVDAGVRVRLGRIQVGVTARNLAAPEFTASDGGTWRLERRVRVGAAVVADAARAGRQAWVVAADADLIRDDHAPGSWRGVGAGVERWFAGRRLAVRGGVEASTAGRARPTATAGLSVAVPGGLFVEVSAAGGAEERRGWGLGAHVMF
jgi:hypothetical protein